MTYFCDKKIPKVDSNHTCLAVISVDSAVKKDENYYSQCFQKNINTSRKKYLDTLLMI